MFSFDEHGNVLIDNTQSTLIDQATRNRTLSRRAHAFTNNQYIPFQPISEHTWRTFSSRFSTAFGNLWKNMKTPVRAIPSPRGPGDIRSVYTKVVTDWISTDLQGFQGALPVMEFSGTSEMFFFLPADGAVIRYLGRLMHKHPGLFEVYLGRGDGFLQTRLATIDGSHATFGDTRHCMTIRVKELFSEGSGRFENNVNMLRGFRKILEIEKILPGLNKIFTTLSRKLRNHDGSWGEPPRFPIVEFQGKVPMTRWSRLGEIHQRFHGNRKDLYGDRSVYEMIDPGLKYPFQQTQSSVSGEYKWIKPRE